MHNQLLDHLKELYKFNSLDFVQKVEAGYLSHNYILKSNYQKYFLKQYRPSPLSRIHEVHTVKFYFAQNNIPIILPLRNSAGSTYFEFDSNIYALFPFVKGLTLSIESLTTQALISLGRTLAQIHLLSKQQYPQISKRAERFSKERFMLKFDNISSVISSFKNPTQFHNALKESLILKKQLVEENTLTEKDLNLPFDHLLHGDYHNHNVFFDHQHNVTQVFDLEKTEIAPRLFELVRSMDYLCFNGEYHESNYQHAHSYLGAYRSIYPFNKDELSRSLQMYYLTKIHSLWIETEHCLNHNTRVDLFLPSQLQTIKYLAENRKSMPDKLYDNSFSTI